MNEHPNTPVHSGGHIGLDRTKQRYIVEAALFTQRGAGIHRCQIRRDGQDYVDIVVVFKGILGDDFVDEVSDGNPNLGWIIVLNCRCAAKGAHTWLHGGRCYRSSRSAVAVAPRLFYRGAISEEYFSDQRRGLGAPPVP